MINGTIFCLVVSALGFAVAGVVFQIKEHVVAIPNWVAILAYVLITLLTIVCGLALYSAFDVPVPLAPGSSW